MKKHRILLSILLIAVLFAAGCGKNAEEPKEEQKTEDGEAEREPPGPGEENWGTAPDYTVPMITGTPIRYLSVNVGRTEEEVNLTWFSPSEEAGQVYWTTAEDTEFENAMVYSTSAAPSETIPGYYVNRVKIGRASCRERVFITV